MSVVTTFEDVEITALTSMTPGQLDDLPFGVVGLDAEGLVERYNATEARMAGLDPETVLGVSFFDDVGQCMNNFMVAQRFEDEIELDEIIPYVLTLRMRPTRVRLRMLATPSEALNFILIER